MNTMTTQPSERSDRRVISKVNMLLLAWFALVAAALIGMSAIPAAQTAGAAAQATPVPRYAYCSKEWRQQQLPANMQATFEDWCEHRPGAINPTGR